jgi:hypothetical protein
VKINFNLGKTKGYSGKRDLELKHWIGYKIKLARGVATLAWDMQDVEVKKGGA